jgi:hypothetical protein
MRRQPLRFGRVIRPVVVLSLAAGAGAVHAQSDDPNPYYVGIRQAFAYNDNLFKQGSGAEQSDVYSSTSLLAGIDQPFGRQRFFLDGSINFDRYQDYKDLDNDGYNITTGLDFQTIGNVSGTLRYSALRGLADYGGPDTQLLTTKNIQETEIFAGNVRWGLTRRLALTALAEHRSLEYSAPSYAVNEYKQNVFGGGVRYGLQELMTFGLGYRVTKTDRDRAQLTGLGPPPTYAPDESDREDIDLTMSWSPSALSTLNARVSKTSEDRSNPAFADFDGWTGAVSWQYRPTAKLNFDLGLTRDTGSEILAANVGGGGQSGTVQNYDTDRVTNSGYIGVNYDMTSKVRLNLRGSNSKTTSEGGSGGVGENIRTQHYTLGVRYAATRSLSFGCGYDYERQNDDSGTGNSYRSSLANCYGQYTIR